jgi:hypothetical protein
MDNCKNRRQDKSVFLGVKMTTHVVNGIGNKEGINSGSVDVLAGRGADRRVILIIEDLSSATLLGCSRLSAFVSNHIVSYQFSGHYFVYTPIRERIFGKNELPEVSVLVVDPTWCQPLGEEDVSAGSVKVLYPFVIS